MMGAPRPSGSRLPFPGLVVAAGAAVALVAGLGAAPTFSWAMSETSPPAEAGQASRALRGPAPAMPILTVARGVIGCDEPEVEYHPRCRHWRLAYRAWQQAGRAPATE